MSITCRWTLEMTARSPISHRAETIGTTSTLRRMKVLAPDGAVELVPVVSGNSLRGVLRRLGEELLRDVLDYEGQLPEPITGRRLRELRALIPQLSVFGGAVGAAPIDGCLRVGHVLPVIEEARPLLRGHYPHRLPGRFDVEAFESYSHLDDPASPGVDLDDDSRAGSSLMMRYEIETLTAGTVFESWVQLDRGSDLDYAFLTDVLAEYRRR